MRSFLTLFALAAALLVKAAPDGTSVQCAPNPGEELCLPTTTTPTKRDLGAEFPEHLTNAQRLARGLPLQSPHRRGSPTRRNAPSGVPSQSYRGMIEVIGTSGNSVLGYVSKQSVNGGSQYGYADITNALVVDFTLPTGQTSGTTLQLTTENSDITGYPNLAFVQGRDDTDSSLTSGSYEYIYFAQANPTAPDAPPQLVGNSYFIGSPRTSESAVWSIDLVTGAFSGQWVNPDNSLPALQCWTQSTALYCGGNESAFHNRYPAPVTDVTFKFIPL